MKKQLFHSYRYMSEKKHNNTGSSERKNVHSQPAYVAEISDKAFIDYDPKKDTRPYEVYRNDIKFRKQRNIDPTRAKWSDDVKADFYSKDTDSIEYRVEECIREKYTMIDLSHMGENCFKELFSHKLFNTIRHKIQHIFAKESKLSVLPDLTCFTELQTLDLSTNVIEVLPNLPESLEELIVNDNRLTEIPHTLPKLLRMDASNNKIEKINFSKALERLHLKNNPISMIPELPKLYHLDLSTTGIRHLHSLPKLRYLDVSYTEIQTIPAMTSLEHLLCNESSVSDISKLNDLHSLEITGSKIVRVQYFKNLMTLVYHAEQRLQLSKNYKILRMKISKANIAEITFVVQHI
jgi:hypothetical protein